MTAPLLRVLLVSARADVGGGPFHVDLLVKHLPANIERWVACPDEAPYAVSWKCDPTVRGVFHIPRRRFSLIALVRLAISCRRCRIDIVHSHGKAAGVYGRLLKLLIPWVKVVHTFHGVHLGQYGRVTRTAYLVAERVLRRLTDVFVNVSEGEKRECLTLGISAADRSHVVCNGIPPLEAPAENAFPELLHGPGKIILTLARFEYQKNMSLALEVAALAQPVHPDWLFVWAGDGPELAGLQRRARDTGLTNIRFLGFSNRTVDLLAAADVFLSASRWEGMPYALLEASCMGVPIVATNVTGNDEVVFAGRNGLLYGLDRPDQAVSMIGRVLEDAACQKDLSRGGREVFLERFSLTESIAATARAYRRASRC